MKDLKNIAKLICIALYALAVIGGTGYCIYIHKWLFAIAIIILGIMAWPTFVECCEASWADKWAKKKDK